MDSHKFETWLEIADEVNTLIREYGREQFLIQTQQAASDYEAACKKYELREKQRLNLLEKNGVLERVEDLPDPLDDNWVVWKKTVRGSLKVPKDFEPPPMQPQFPDVPNEIRGLLPTRPFTDQQYTAWIPHKKEFDAWRKANNDCREARLEVFRLVKERGFPNDTKCDYVYEYVFDLQCLIPDELSPDDHPSRDWPLPVQRELTLAEKFAVLAAVHAAHWKGAANIEPWGTNLPGVPKELFKQASWYEILLDTAKELDVLDVAQIRFVGDLLADVESKLQGEALVESKQGSISVDDKSKQSEIFDTKNGNTFGNTFGNNDAYRAALNHETPNFKNYAEAANEDLRKWNAKKDHKRASRNLIATRILDKNAKKSTSKGSSLRKAVDKYERYHLSD